MKYALSTLSHKEDRMAINANAKIGFWTAIGVVAGLLVWNFVSTKVPAIKTYSG